MKYLNTFESHTYNSFINESENLLDQFISYLTDLKTRIITEGHNDKKEFGRERIVEMYYTAAIKNGIKLKIIPNKVRLKINKFNKSIGGFSRLDTYADFHWSKGYIDGIDLLINLLNPLIESQIFESNNLEKTIAEFDEKVKVATQNLREFSIKMRGTGTFPWDTDEGLELKNQKDILMKQRRVLKDEYKAIQLQVYTDKKLKKKVRKVVLSKTNSKNIKSLDLVDMYPKKFYPLLWEQVTTQHEEKLQSTFFFKSPNTLHTIYRGIHANELEYIRSSGLIQSNQSMNFGYEIEQNMTVFSYTPSSAINYASSFATKEFQPTKDNPNYLIEVAIDDENIIVDDMDEYVKSLSSISAKKILRVFEVLPKNKVGKEIKL